MTIRNGYAWAIGALLGTSIASMVSAQGYGDMLKGAAKDAAKQQAADTAQEAIGGAAPANAAGGAAPADAAGGAAPAPVDAMGRVNSAAGAGVGAAAQGAMGGNLKGAAMQGGQAAVADWQKTGAAAAAGASAPAANAPAVNAPAADTGTNDAGAGTDTDEGAGEE